MRKAPLLDVGCWQPFLDPVSSMDHDDDHTETNKETEYRRDVIAALSWTSFYIHSGLRRVGANVWSVILNS